MHSRMDAFADEVVESLEIAVEIAYGFAYIAIGILSIPIWLPILVTRRIYARLTAR